jgi:aspartate-semialdehyde dehydrogenase
MLAVLEQRRFAHADLRVFASVRSAGQRLPYCGGELVVEALTDQWPPAGPGGGPARHIDCALLSAGSAISKAMGPKMAAAGTVVIDNSSAFRMTPGVPLTIPEVNPGSLAGLGRRGGEAGPGAIIANPNCSTIILLVAVTPLHRALGVERLVVSTYQAASGAGWQAMEGLERETRAVLNGGTAEASVFHEPYAFNLFSHNSAVDARTGLNVEEQKMVDETRKIWGDEAGGAARVRISATCVRVPVMRAHCESVNVTLSRPATLTQVRALLAAAPGVRVIDDRTGNAFPTPLKASGGDDVLVGRLRVDLSQLEGEARAAGTDLEHVPTRGFDMFIAGDQLRKGAAQNAVQIAELVFG